MLQWVEPYCYFASIASAALMGLLGMWVTFKPPSAKVHWIWLVVFTLLAATGIAAAVVDRAADERRNAQRDAKVEALMASSKRIETRITAFLDTSQKLPITTPFDPSAISFSIKPMSIDGKPVPNGYTFAAEGMGSEEFESVWDFGDGTPPIRSRLPVNHVFSKRGNYPVTMTVLDSSAISRYPATLSLGTSRKR